MGVSKLRNEKNPRNLKSRKVILEPKKDIFSGKQLAFPFSKSVNASI